MVRYRPEDLNLKDVLFDLAGTLMEPKSGYLYNRSVISKRLGIETYDLWPLLIREKISLRESAGIDFALSRLAKFNMNSLEHYSRRIKLKRYAKECVEKLHNHGLTLGIVSLEMEPIIDVITKKLGRNNFKYVYGQPIHVDEEGYVDWSLTSYVGFADTSFEGFLYDKTNVLDHIVFQEDIEPNEILLVSDAYDDLVFEKYPGLFMENSNPKKDIMEEETSRMKENAVMSTNDLEEAAKFILAHSSGESM